MSAIASGQLLPITPPRDQKAEQALAEQLAAIAKIDGEFKPTADAEQCYSDWYIRNRAELKKPGMGLLAPFWGRFEGIVWKLAMIFEASANPQMTAITEDSVRLAIQWAERLKRDLVPLIQQELTTGAWAQKVHKVRELIRAAGKDGIQRSELLRHSHLTSKELNEVVTTLTEGDVLDIRTVVVKSRSVIFYRLKAFDSPIHNDSQDPCEPTND